ncbi:hypothetical protein [Nocardia xishanensis]
MSDSNGPSAAPSGATAIAAAVLTLVATALMLGYYAIPMSLASVDPEPDPDISATLFRMVALVVAVITALYGLGAILLLCRKEAGQVIVNVISVSLSIIVMFGVLTGSRLAILGFFLHVSVCFLASVDSTSRWLTIPRPPYAT